jgi:hypothetical protein
MSMSKAQTIVIMVVLFAVMVWAFRTTPSSQQRRWGAMGQATQQ